MRVSINSTTRTTDHEYVYQLCNVSATWGRQGAGPIMGPGSGCRWVGGVTHHAALTPATPNVANAVRMMARIVRTQPTRHGHASTA